MLTPKTASFARSRLRRALGLQKAEDGWRDDHVEEEAVGVPDATRRRSK
jgi:hypothetical protein